ncbi:MAG TPA: NAD(P)H-dependent oxidoreductase [Dongiaceae bacterium]|jgi:nitroreductase|nr:NAD(P)H-dependent oxidoreductase [Dongiaceae bacterium]
MNPITNEQLLAALNWRYATKVFDATKKIPAPVWETLTHSLVLTPTSYGLQPYRFLVIADPAKRAELLPHSWNQKQVVDASHFVVFTARTRMTEADVDRFIARTSNIRGIPAATLNAYRGMMLSDVVNGPRGKAAHEWATRQAYIALGNLMTCAALLGVDTCPMEGLAPAEYDRVLGLAGGDYLTVVACALGYRATTDKYAALTKVRYDVSEVIHTI